MQAKMQNRSNFPLRQSKTVFKHFSAATKLVKLIPATSRSLFLSPPVYLYLDTERRRRNKKQTWIPPCQH